MRRDPRRGFTLIELATSLAILTVVLLSASEIFIGTLRAQSTLSMRDVLEDQLGRVLVRLEQTLRPARLATLSEAGIAPQTSTSIRYQTLVGYDSTSGPSWSAEQRIAFLLAGGEEANGQDDDGDRYIDEGSVVLQNGSLIVPIGRSVNGLTFSLAGRRLTIVVAGQTVDASGNRIEVQRSGDVILRN